MPFCTGERGTTCTSPQARTVVLRAAEWSGAVQRSWGPTPSTGSHLVSRILPLFVTGGNYMYPVVLLGFRFTEGPREVLHACLLYSTSRLVQSPHPHRPRARRGTAASSSLHVGGLCRVPNSFGMLLCEQKSAVLGKKTSKHECDSRGLSMLSLDAPVGGWQVSN